MKPTRTFAALFSLSASGRHGAVRRALCGARYALPLLLAAALAAPAQADTATYTVDLLVFVQGGADGESPLAVTPHDFGRVYEPDDSAALRAVGIHILSTDGGGLASVATHFGAPRYQRLASLSWVQSNPPDGRGPALHIHGGGSVETPFGSVPALDGTVTLHGGFYLHVDANLIWTQRDASGNAVSFHLDENRRLRLNEIHYLDNARIGVITRVRRAG